jgi:hypothetical protein
MVENHDLDLVRRLLGEALKGNDSASLLELAQTVSDQLEQLRDEAEGYGMPARHKLD